MTSDQISKLEQARQEAHRLRKELKASHEELQRTNSELLQLTLELEDRVAARTAQLQASKEELARHRDHLQEMVDERTVELRQLNEILEDRVNDLKASEERFRSLVLTIPDIVYRIDEEGYFTYINSAVRQLGYEPVELIGKHFGEIVVPADLKSVSRDKVLSKLKNKKTGPHKAPKLFDERRTGDRRTTGLEVRLVARGRGLVEGVIAPIGRETVIVEVNSSGLYGISGGFEDRVLVGTVGVIRDITERKKNEELVLRQSATLNAINQVFQETLTCQTEEDLASLALVMALDLTRSQLGFICEKKEDGPFECMSLYDPDSGGREPSKSKAKNLIDKLPLQNLREQVVSSAQSVMANDLDSQPDRTILTEEAPRVVSYLGVPLKQGEKVIGVISLLNKESGYEAEDQRAVEMLAVAFVEALNSKRQEVELKQHRDHLESLVSKRTRQLQKRNRQLQREIEERLTAEALLRESEQKYRHLYESSRDGITVSDMKGNLLEANQAFQDMLGYNLDEIKKLSSPQLTPEKWRDMEREIIHHEVFTLGYSREYEKEAIRKNGQVIPIAMRAWLVKDRDGNPTGMWAMVRDETERRRAMQEKIQMEKMSALGTMVAGVAHELNNPLMGILNYVQYCLKRIPPDDRKHGILTDAERETKRCVDIIRNLLTFSRMEPETDRQYQNETAANIFDRILKLLSYRIESERVKIAVDPALKTTELHVIPNQIQQVFLNIMINALDALKESKKRKINIEVKPGGEFVEIIFQDTGPGINPENIGKIFDPFFTTKPVGRGTGLGLSVSQGIVKAHGGEIVCESRLGSGTQFRVKLLTKAFSNLPSSGGINA